MHFIPLCITAIKNEEDREFMQTLYASCTKLMYRSAMRITHNLADADDAVGAACEALVRCVDKLRHISPKAHSAYVVSTVRNQALMLLRRRRIERRAYEHLVEQNAIPREEVPPEVDARLLYRCTLTEIVEAICRLSVDDQTILRLKFFDHLPDLEIAAILDVQPSTVRTKVSRARRRLHAALKENQDDQ